MEEEKQSYRRQSGCEAAYKMKKSGMREVFGVGENEKNQNKMRYEKIIMNISLIGSICLCCQKDLWHIIQNHIRF